MLVSASSLLVALLQPMPTDSFAAGRDVRGLQIFFEASADGFAMGTANSVSHELAAGIAAAEQ